MGIEVDMTIEKIHIDSNSYRRQGKVYIVGVTHFSDIVQIIYKREVLHVMFIFKMFLGQKCS